jgi:hypothetical protein
MYYVSIQFVRLSQRLLKIFKLFRKKTNCLFVVIILICAKLKKIEKRQKRAKQDELSLNHKFGQVVERS